MEKGIFAEFVEKSVKFFERKPPSGETVSLWFDEVRFISAQALPYISERLRELEYFPRNLPAFMHGAAKAWKKFNPGQGPRSPKDECRDGYWEVAQWKPSLGKWAIFRFLCACRGGVIKERYNLLDEDHYKQGPDRYQDNPHSWMLIYPDEEGLKKMRQRIFDHLESRRRPEQIGLAANDLPF